MSNEYNPDFVSSPGEILREMMDESGMKPPSLAYWTGLPLIMILEILRGVQPINEDIATRLQMTFGSPSAKFWLNREKRYRENE